ncbi:MAG: PAS domain S-box protein [Trueperaceae bacterium]|nr:PAS domain S-box protein [Trueperaceae bacterium]
MSSTEHTPSVERFGALPPHAEADLMRIVRLLAGHVGAQRSYLVGLEPSTDNRPHFKVWAHHPAHDNDAPDGEALQTFWQNVCAASGVVVQQTGPDTVHTAVAVRDPHGDALGVLGVTTTPHHGEPSNRPDPDTLRDYASLALSVLSGSPEFPHNNSRDSDSQNSSSQDSDSQDSDSRSDDLRNEDRDKAQGDVRNVVRGDENTSPDELGAQLRAVVESIQDRVFIRDTQGRFVFCNQAFADLYGLSIDELLGKTIDDLADEDEVEQIRASDQQVLEHHTTQHYETTIARSGKTYTYLVSKHPYTPSQNGVSGVVGIAHDITERRADGERTQLLASVVKNIEESIVITTPRLEPPGPQIVFVNEAFTDMTGYEPNDVLGKTPRILQGPGSSPEVVKKVRERLEKRQPFRGETINYRKDGSEFTINWYIVPLRDEAGVITHFVAVQRDVTEQRRREERMRLLESAVVNAKDAILITEATPIDAPGPRIHYVNPAFTKITGYDATEVIGRSPRFLQGADTDRRALDKIRQGLEHDTSVQAELVNYTKAGEPYWIELNITPVTDSEGRTSHYVAVQRDISERKQVEQRLQDYAARLNASNQTLRSFYDSAPIMMGLVEIDDDKIVHLSDNKAAAQFFRTRADDMSGHSSDDLGVPRDYTDLWIQAYEQSYDLGEPLRFEYRHVWPSGDEHWLNVAVNYIGPGPSGRRRFSYVVDDFTERKLASDRALTAKREAERANAAKSEFLSRMSHELRTPLNAILGFSQLLQMGELDPEERDNVDDIRKAGEHLLELINEVLDIARIESGHMSLSIEPVEVDEVIEESLELIIPLAKERDLTVNVPNQSSQHFVMADRQRLKQVLLNLLSNAVKYNRTGGRIDIGYHRTPQGLAIEVRDTGQGISEAQRRDLFKAFERLDADKTSVQGTGIGLTLTKRLVELMHGDIEVDSVPERGSTFRIIFETATAPELGDEGQDALDEQSEIAADDSVGTANKVLYIEDNLSNLKLIRRIVGRIANIELMSAMQGSIGLTLAREHRPAVILLDLHLPDMDGDAVLQKLQQDENTRDIPVVMISADATPNQIERLKAMGAYDYLTKPLDIPHFLNVLSDLLDNDDDNAPDQN